MTASHDKPARALLGLIGANIQHSISPALHADAFAQCGIDGYYHLIDLDHVAAPFETLFDAVRATGFAGVNITHPCKERVLPLLDMVDPRAAAIGAVNTAVIDRDGRTKGYNTDHLGFRRAFEETFGTGLLGAAPVLVIGAGGAGRAIAHALIDLGALALAIFDQDTARAVALSASLDAAHARAVTNLAQAVDEAGGLVNATPTGMWGHPGAPVPVELLRAEVWVADAVYSPLETELIAAARRAGCKVMTGGSMCVHQAAEAFRLFTGRSADVSRLAQVFAAAAARREPPR